MAVQRRGNLTHPRISKRSLDSGRLLSLFCGAGGLDEGFRQARFKSVAAVDKDTAACKTYKRNHPQALVVQADLATVGSRSLLKKIRQIKPQNRPIGVIGGPPCQAFSQGNSFKRSRDKRGALPKHYAALLKTLNARLGLDFFVFENVTGLLSCQLNGRFKQFISAFREGGFLVFDCTLNAVDYGVPQDRNRIFVIGFNAKRFPKINFAMPALKDRTPKTVGSAIGHLKEPTFFKRGLKGAKKPLHPNHWCMVPRSSKFKNDFLLKSKKKGRSFRVIDANKPSPTVAYGHREVSVHPSGVRRLSVYEAMLLQGFPKRYRLLGNLTEQIRLVSDAVPPPLAKVLAKEIRDTIDRYRKCAKQKHAGNPFKRQPLHGSSL